MSQPLFKKKSLEKKNNNKKNKIKKINKKWGQKEGRREEKNIWSDTENFSKLDRYKTSDSGSSENTDQGKNKQTKSILRLIIFKLREIKE